MFLVNYLHLIKLDQHQNFALHRYTSLPIMSFTYRPMRTPPGLVEPGVQSSEIAPRGQAQATDVVQSHFTRNAQLLTELEAANRSATNNQMILLDNLKDRSDAMIIIAKKCRDLRLMMVYDRRGEVTDADRAKHKIPKIRGQDGSGVSEMLDYCTSTLDVLAEQLVNSHHESRATSRAARVATDTLQSHSAAYEAQRARDDDEISMVSNWNRFDYEN